MSEPIRGLILPEVVRGWTELDIGPLCSSVQVSLTVDGVSQVTAVVADTGLGMVSGFLLQKYRRVRYLGAQWEVSAMSVGAGQARGSITLELRSAMVQALKRVKGAEVAVGADVTQWISGKVANIGSRYAVRVQPGLAAQDIVQMSGDDVDESAWDVMGALAATSNRLLFETDGTLVMADEEYLVGRNWGGWVVEWPGSLNSDADPTKVLRLLGIPELRTSDDDANGATGSLLVHRDQGEIMRPGMAVTISGLGVFDTTYLVSEVVWEVGSRRPVTVGIRTPAPAGPPPAPVGSWVDTGRDAHGADAQYREHSDGQVDIRTVRRNPDGSVSVSKGTAIR